MKINQLKNVLAVQKNKNKSVKSGQRKKKGNPRVEDWYSEIWQTVGKCVFCDLRDKYVIMEENNMVLTVNIYPYIDGHLMIIPRKHVTHLKQLTSTQWETVRAMEYACKKLLREMFDIQTLWMLYREGPIGEASEKTVDHLHIHILPFKPELVTWNYQELKYTPLQMASQLKKNTKVLNKLIKRHKEKYEAA